MIYELSWSTDHLVDEPFDAEIVQFDGWKLTRGLYYNCDVPDPVYFEANFSTLQSSDFPYNNAYWALMSDKFLNLLTDKGTFKHETHPVTMIDDTVMESDRYDAEGNPKSSITSSKFTAICIQEHLDIIDRSRSLIEFDEDQPETVALIEKLVVSELPAQAPSIFYITGIPMKPFVLASVKEECEAQSLQGMKFIPLEEFVY